MTVNPSLALTQTVEVTIASGSSLTDVINLGGNILAGVHMPASWTAANLTLQACDTADGTFLDIYDEDGIELTLTAAASRAISVDSRNTLPWRFIKIRSGTAASAVNQTADRTLKIEVGRPDV